MSESILSDDDVPAEAQAFAKQAAEAFPVASDAIESALTNFRALPNHAELSGGMERTAMSKLVYGYRHKQNVAIKNAAKSYHSQQRRNPCDSPADLLANAISVFQYSMGGRALGLLVGKELDEVAVLERKRADGHLFNVRLCQRIRPYVADAQRVSEVLSEVALYRLFADTLGGDDDQAPPLARRIRALQGPNQPGATPPAA